MKNLDSLGGRVLKDEEIRHVEAATGIRVPGAISLLLSSRPMVGVNFVVPPEADESGMGADFRFMTAAEMIEESVSAYPGISAVSHGFLPVGVCLEGSGDPYFVRLSDGAVVRIPHDAVSEDLLDLGLIEMVASSLERLVEIAET